MNPGTCQDHCCLEHGCKYSHEDCPVLNGTLKQSYPCESCPQPSDKHLASYILLHGVVICAGCSKRAPLRVEISRDTDFKVWLPLLWFYCLVAGDNWEDPYPVCSDECGEKVEENGADKPVPSEEIHDKIHDTWNGEIPNLG